MSHRRCKKAKKELSHAITITYTSSQMTLHYNQGVFGLGERQSIRLVIDDVFLVSLLLVFRYRRFKRKKSRRIHAFNFSIARAQPIKL